jgi:hypothetical protein
MTSQSQLLGHLAYKIGNARIRPYPFPHIYIQDVFPADFYTDFITNLPAESDYSFGKSSYHGRRFADPAKDATIQSLATPEFLKIAISPFRDSIGQKFGIKPIVHTDLRLIRDQENYSIGPHTDAPWKILSFLFYLPSDDSLKEHGTSIYLPNDPTFRCVGGPHHPTANFTRIYTAPYVPNSLFAFFKTDQSFHGVERITIPCRRDLLLWNLYDSTARNGKTTG